MRGNDQESPPLRGDLCENLAKPIKFRRLANESASGRYTCFNAEQMTPATQPFVANRVKRRCKDVLEATRSNFAREM